MEQYNLYYAQQQKILLALFSKDLINHTQLAKKINTDTSAITKSVKLLKKDKLIVTIKEGRVIIITLTEKGIYVAQRLSEIYKRLKEM